MAAFDQQQLDVTQAGAVVLLREPSRVAWTEQLQGVQATLAVGSRGLVLQGMTPAPASSMRLQARTLANHVLDLVCVRSAGAFALAEPAAPSVVWAAEPTGSWVQLDMEVQSTFSLTAGGGPWAYPLTWHPSMRYSRMSQTTTDLYDAFRNLYLGLESLLDDVAPMRTRTNGKPGEGEWEWTLRAVRAAGARLAFSTSTPTGLQAYLATPSASDPADDVMAELYGLRTEVFHAKTGRPVALPQVHRDQERVREALDRYGRFFTDLLEHMHRARFLRSGMSNQAVARMFEQLETWEVGLSGRALPTIEAVEEDGLMDMSVLPTERAPDLDGPPRRGAILGRASVEELPLPIPIKSVGIRSKLDRLPVSGDVLGGDLVLDGFDQVEVAAYWRVGSAGTKSAYDT